MYIDTHSESSMNTSVCKLFNITHSELSKLIGTASEKATKEGYFDTCIFYETINELIDFKKVYNRIDRILFFHLSRRLNSSNDSLQGNNLFNLLTTENVFSDFLKKHGVCFSPCEGYLELYYNSKLISLENTYEPHVPYLRKRLGYNKGREDFCFNGFAFKDLLYLNSYARELYFAPEFIGVLATFLKCNDIKTDYCLNSKYYCFKYCIPIDMVLFDNDDKLSIERKRVYLINKVIDRLYDYSVTEIKYMNDHDNPILRLSDLDTMHEKYLVEKEDITVDMLGLKL